MVFLTSLMTYSSLINPVYLFLMNWPSLTEFSIPIYKWGNNDNKNISE